jgi:hypothetical protein
MTTKEEIVLALKQLQEAMLALLEVQSQEQQIKVDLIKYHNEVLLAKETLRAIRQI